MRFLCICIGEHVTAATDVGHDMPRLVLSYHIIPYHATSYTRHVTFFTFWAPGHTFFYFLHFHFIYFPNTFLWFWQDFYEIQETTVKQRFYQCWISCSSVWSSRKSFKIHGKNYFLLTGSRARDIFNLFIYLILYCLLLNFMKME